MLLGLLAAAGTALCYGVSSILEAVAARRTTAVEGLDPRLMVRLLRSWIYVAGVCIDGFGFLLSLVAVRSLPLFVVQSVVASFLAITAILGAVFLRMPLSRARPHRRSPSSSPAWCWSALSATEDRSVSVSDAEQWGLLGRDRAARRPAVPLARLRGAAGATGRWEPSPASRSGRPRSPPGCCPATSHPATWRRARTRLLPARRRTPSGRPGAVAILTYSIALQRGSVTEATAPLVVGETVAPALVGLLLLGDQTRPGWGTVGRGRVRARRGRRRQPGAPRRGAAGPGV